MLLHSQDQNGGERKSNVQVGENSFWAAAPRPQLLVRLEHRTDPVLYTHSSHPKVVPLVVEDNLVLPGTMWSTKVFAKDNSTALVAWTQTLVLDKMNALTLAFSAETGFLLNFWPDTHLEKIHHLPFHRHNKRSFSRHIHVGDAVGLNFWILSSSSRI